MSDLFFPIERVSLFAADGQVYRAFDHLIAARMGTLLLVPMHLVTGRCDAVIDGCQVPWEEVHAVLEYPSGNAAAWQGIDDHVQQLEYLGIDPAECEMDLIAAMVNGKEKVLRLVHPSGMRYAVVIK
jgi:hypothetical protein